MLQVESNKAIPFCIAVAGLPDEDKMDRGYRIYPGNATYDPLTQVSDMVCGGDTAPTTWSSITSTGIINDDSDDAQDDTGKD